MKQYLFSVALDEMICLTKAFFANTYSPPVVTDRTRPPLALTVIT
jgi:hypothetical protein